MAERGRLSDTSGRPRGLPAAAALFPLRLFLGATFVYAGMQKLSDPGFLTPGAGTYIGTQLRGFAAATPGGFLLRGLAIPHAELAGVLAAVTELVVGVLVLSGLLTRIAAGVGLAFSLLLFLTASWHTNPYFLGSDIVFVFAWLPVALAGAAGQPALDTLRQRRSVTVGGADVPPAETAIRARRAVSGLDRRAFLRRSLAGAGVLTAGLAALSVLIRGGRPGLRRAQAKPLAGASGTATAAPRGTGSAIPSGAVGLGPAARLAVGGAVSYRDPADGSPDIVTRVAGGTLSALSAVCTHAGCECTFAPDAQGGQLVCPCHGSLFDARTGAVVQGPATQPLPRRRVVELQGTLYAVPQSS